MATAFHELPLALFATLASIGAGAFISLAAAFFTAKFSDGQLARIDKLTLVPAIVVVVGFIAAFFHLANPMAAFGVFGGLGRSPMSNELAVAMLFAVAMATYVIMGLAGKLGGARKGLICATAVLAVCRVHGAGIRHGHDPDVVDAVACRADDRLRLARRCGDGRLRAGVLGCARRGG